MKELYKLTIFMIAIIIFVVGVSFIVKPRISKEDPLIERITYLEMRVSDLEEQVYILEDSCNPSKDV